MPKIVVTGGSGRVGRAVVRDLLAQGYEVLNVDRVAPDERLCPLLRADLTDAGQAFDALSGAEAVVHLAAIPTSGWYTEPVTFQTNLMSTYHVFHAAVALGLRRVVWASSIQVYGIPFEREAPAYLPVDEAHPTRAWTDYPLSKILAEEMARHLSRRAATVFVGLRLSWVVRLEEDMPSPVWRKNQLASGHLWSYVDARDAAQGCRRALEADLTGAEVFNIAAADTTARQTNAELVAAAFPGTPLRPGTGDFATLYSIEKARRLLGYQPLHSWRDSMPAPEETPDAEE